MAGLDVWAAHFGLTRTPFTKTVPANKLFDRAAHAEAVARIHYCINEAALGVVVGDTGAGKTVAVRAAVASLDRTKFTLVYLSNPSGGCRGMYVAIATALGATPRFHKAEAINQAAALLAAEEHERHRRVIFVIDEAHLLSPEQLEELRLLSNADLDSASPFAGILLGQPTLAVRRSARGQRRPPHRGRRGCIRPEPEPGAERGRDADRGRRDACPPAVPVHRRADRSGSRLSSSHRRSAPPGPAPGLARPPRQPAPGGMRPNHAGRAA
jgi:AAA domain